MDDDDASSRDENIFVSKKAVPCRSGIAYHWRAFCRCPIDVCLVLVMRISSGLTR